MTTRFRHDESTFPAAPHPCCTERRSSLGLALLPALGVALLPKCPICVAAYLGVFGSLGAGAWLRSAWGLPLTSVCLLLAIAALGFRARRRRGFGPLLLGIAASATLLAGKFVLDPSPALVAAGAALLIAASVWNTWPARPSTSSRSPTTLANHP